MEENRSSAAQAKSVYNRMGFGLFAIAAATTLLQVLLSALGMAGLLDMQKSWILWVITFAPLYLVGIPLGLLIMRRAPADRAEGETMSVGKLLVFLLMCFPLMYGGNLIGTMLSMLLSGGTAENPLNSFAFDNSPLKILVVVILAPLAEEFIFRKQLIDRTVRFGEKPAILFSALCFGLFHMNLFQFFYAFALGLLFAYIYTRTRRLRYSMALHMIVNFLGSVLAPYFLSGVDENALEQLLGGQMDPEALVQALPQLAGVLLYSSALMGLSVAGLVLLIVRARRAEFRPAAEELQGNQIFSCVYLRPGFVVFALLCAVVCVISLVGLKG